MRETAGSKGRVEGGKVLKRIRQWAWESESVTNEFGNQDKALW